MTELHEAELRHPLWTNGARHPRPRRTDGALKDPVERFLVLPAQIGREARDHK